jgi:YHS domain-containing protein
MTVDRTKATNRSVVNGKVVYFCGAGCKRKFDANPLATPAAEGGHHH